MSQSNSALANAIANKQGANSKLSAANTKSKGNLGNKQSTNANSKLPPKKKFPREKNYDEEDDEEEGADGEGGSEEDDEYGDEDGSGNDGGAQGGAVGYGDDDHWFSDSSASDGAGGEDRQPRMVMYAAWTQYDVVKEVGKNVFGYHLTKNDQREYDIAWFDGPISIKFLQKMWPHQRVNHFPGMYNLARKNCLGRHLMRM